MPDAAVIEGRIRNALHSINRDYEGTLVPITGGAIGHQTRRAFPPMPVSANVLDARSMACSVMAGWAKVVITDRKITGCGLRGTDAAGMVTFLTRHAAWLADFGAGEDVAEELEQSAHDLHVIAAPSVPDWTSLGSCPLEQERDGLLAVCGGQVRAHPIGDPTCQRCGVAQPTGMWEHAMFPEASRLITGKQLAHEIHKQRGQRVAEVTIRVWLNRGVIASVGVDTQGRRLYDRIMVAKALAQAETA